MSDSADRALLLGLLALQTGRIREDQLIAALRVWAADKDRPLDERLIALGWLDEPRREELNTLADLHVAAHEGDIEKSLGSIPIGAATRAELAAILGGGAELGATITRVGSDATTDHDAGRSSGGSGDDQQTADGPRFRVIRPLAKGGLGAVYVAMDTELHREVALKQILEDHADNPASRGRFLIEAEITGGLEHPGIVPVYGLGTYGDGRPYYAMRFIRGDTLHDAIEAFHKGPKTGPERSLAFRRLLRKFTDVCNTIDYAHARGVLHRDIKPANVIVGKHGETLVVDWGLAKALGRTPADADERALTPASGEASGLTLPGRAMGTPAYMSPEQARGELEKLDARCDVYSLGATLFHVLIGRAPFDGSTPKALEAVEAGEFPRPRALDSSIDPAFEAIVLKAMAREPEARYASARALADDVDRWMADERVEAFPEPWTRTLNRWLTRHRTSVTGVAAAGLVALAALGIISVAQSRANAALKIQRARAEANETEAIEAVKRFKDAIANNPELKDNPELESLRKTLLKEPLAFFERLHQRLGADGDTRPEALLRLADAAFDHAKLVGEIGGKQDAIQVFRQALEIDERLVRDHPGDADYLAGLANSHANLGDLLTDTGRFDEARAAHARAIEIRERLVRDHPADADHQSSLAASFTNIGKLLHDMGRTDELRTSIERAIEIFERLTRDHPTVTEYQVGLAANRGNLGILLREMGRADEALATCARAIEIQERLTRDHPAVAEHQVGLANSHSTLGQALRDLGRTGEARTAFERAIGIGERLVGEHPAVADHQVELAKHLDNLGSLLRDMGQPDDARAAINRAIDIGERLVRDHPAVVEHQLVLGSLNESLGKLLLAAHRADEARAAIDRAIDIGERLVHDHPEVPDYASCLADAVDVMAVIELRASRHAESRERSLEAIIWRRKVLASRPADPQYRQAFENNLSNLIVAERELGHEDETTRAERELAEFRINDPRFAAVEARLKTIMAGETPRDAAERLALAQRAYDTSRFHLAARLWGDALDADPKLGEDRQLQRPYNAACAAALAAAGKGSAPPGDAAEKTRLRGRALGWLKAEKDAWAKLLESTQPQDRQTIAKILQHWTKDADLTDVRGPDALAKLPENERTEWEALWKSVDELLAGAE